MLYNSSQKIQHYDLEMDILKEFYVQREDLYSLRKQFMLAHPIKEHDVLSNKVSFI